MSGVPCGTAIAPNDSRIVEFMAMPLTHRDNNEGMAKRLGHSTETRGHSSGGVLECDKRPSI